MQWNCGVVILHVLLIGYDHVILSAKTFFKYSKYHSATSMLLELGLPSFDTLIICEEERFGYSRWEN